MKKLIVPNRLTKFCVLLVFFIMLFEGCKKNDNPSIIPVEAGLKSNFSYKTGSYWIYKDSVSGAIDSAFVTSNITDYYYPGCVLSQGESKLESIEITVKVSGNNPSDSECWYFQMSDSTFSLAMYNNRDSVESRLRMALFKYPFVNVAALHGGGCSPSTDSGSVTDIIPVVSIGGQNYSNAARSGHAESSYNGDPSGRWAYNDCFYVNEKAGLVKIVFNHPYDSIHRVLELQRYRIVH